MSALDDLAIALHLSSRVSYNAGKAAFARPCFYRSDDGNFACIKGRLEELARGGTTANDTGELCPHCKGTGYEPFREWENLTDAEVEGYHMQAKDLITAFPSAVRFSHSLNGS